MSFKEHPFVKSVVTGSYAEKLGITANDKLISINGNKICDYLDLLFSQADEKIKLTFLNKNGKLKKVSFLKGFDEPLGVVLEPFKVKKCKNKCIFCFVHQLPKGLRKNLYVKDEDYRLSFLYGNYVTFSDVTDNEILRIIKQILSPVYISVHTTDSILRNKMLTFVQFELN